MTAVSSTLGIDFGTSNSAAGYAIDGVPRLIDVEAGENTLPTALFFDVEEKRIISVSYTHLTLPTTPYV